MQLKKGPLVLSFALSTLLVVGTTGFAHGSNSDGAANMLNANENGMKNMMNAMNSPEGQEMMTTCANFMESIGDDQEAK